MIVYLSMLPVAMHAWTGISQVDAFFACVFVLVNGCILLACRILRRHSLCAKPDNRLFLLGIAYYGLFFMPTGSIDFGQREHIFCALIFPYLALMLMYLDGHAPTRRQQIIAGLLAGIGFAIKPTFPLLFVTAELFLLIRRKKIASVWRPETILITAINLVYYAWILLHSPEIVPLFLMNLTNQQGYHSSMHDIWTHAHDVFAIPDSVLLVAAPIASPRPVFLFLVTLACCGGCALYRPAGAVFLSPPADSMAGITARSAGRRRLLAAVLLLCRAVFACDVFFQPARHGRQGCLPPVFV